MIIIYICGSVHSGLLFIITVYCSYINKPVFVDHEAYDDKNPAWQLRIRSY